MKRQTYTVKQAFPHRGEIVRPGAKVELHPRQAKYLIGTHLERPEPAKPASKGKGGAKTQGGDS